MERRAGTALRASTAVAHRVGDFELTDVLGTGGSASVYAATDLRDGTRVALKILDVEAARHADHRTAFLREAALAAAVRHPGAIRIHESGESAPSDTPPRAWIAMELLPGTTLGAHVREHGPLTPTDALALAATLLEVLRASHRAGGVHRDVTPANVMLGADPATRLDPAGVR
ncbi:MAG: protein kinase, partial [Actinobacteria bacterium]|nr:protein kinase [Actinomycetota bacterium]